MKNPTLESARGWKVAEEVDSGKSEGASNLPTNLAT